MLGHTVLGAPVFVDDQILEGIARYNLWMERTLCRSASRPSCARTSLAQLGLGQRLLGAVHLCRYIGIQPF